LIFAGIKNVPEITMVEAVSDYKNFRRDGIHRRFAAGFTAVDFILWDLTNDSEVFPKTVISVIVYAILDGIFLFLDNIVLISYIIRCEYISKSISLYG
jgi:hypothetical protein